MKTNFTQKTNTTSNLSFLKIVLLSLFLMVFFSSYSQTNSCNATLKVDYDLNIGSSNPEGSFYKMILTNTSSYTDTFSLSYLTINASCSNSDGSSTAGNINLEASFVDLDFSPINEVLINPGQSLSFYTHITIPVGTAIKKWCCTKIIAQSKTCTNYKTDTVLHTFYAGPDEN